MASICRTLCNAQAHGIRCTASSRLNSVRVKASAAVPRSGAKGMQRPEPNPNICGVFQLSDSPRNLTLNLNDVRDAYEACSSARSPSERRQCFEVYGLDADKVDRYYDRVCQMERLIDQGDSVAQNMVASGGAMFLYFMAYCILRV